MLSPGERALRGATAGPARKQMAHSEDEVRFQAELLRDCACPVVVSTVQRTPPLRCQRNGVRYAGCSNRLCASGGRFRELRAQVGVVSGCGSSASPRGR